jgi:hypothetical protein
MENLKGHNLFLIDAIGAFISAVFLFILYIFQEFIGLPKNVLVSFICIAVVFSIYSVSIYFTKPVHWPLYLKIIATLNMGYCLFTLYQMVKNSDSLTLYGYLYFLPEMILISGLSIYEFKNAI